MASGTGRFSHSQLRTRNRFCSVFILSACYVSAGSIVLFGLLGLLVCSVGVLLFCLASFCSILLGLLLAKYLCCWLCLFGVGLCFASFCSSVVLQLWCWSLLDAGLLD
ncbi:hypothetical protein LOK49_Contig40G00019 [Camellia lanceoleosa]|nr:hypothetical protein LOK49_Contig40G00019 [Camellia lanceoleosa]